MYYICNTNYSIKEEIKGSIMNIYTYVLIKSLFVLSLTAVIFYLTKDWKCFLFLLFMPCFENKDKDDE